MVTNEIIHAGNSLPESHIHHHSCILFTITTCRLESMVQQILKPKRRSVPIRQLCITSQTAAQDHARAPHTPHPQIIKFGYNISYSIHASIYSLWDESSIYSVWEESRIYSLWEESSKYSLWEESSKYSLWEESSKYSLWEESSKYSLWEESSIYSLWEESSIYSLWEESSKYSLWEESSIYIYTVGGVKHI